MSEVQQKVVDEQVEVVVPLSREDAEQLDKRIRLAAGQFVADWVKFQGLIDDARRGQVHLTLGYPSWTAYVAEVGQDLLALPTANAEVRREVLEWLSSTGMSLRAIAQVAGLSKSTVGRELSAVPSGTPDASGSAEPQASANDLAQGSNYGHVDSGGDQSAVPSGTPADEQKTVGLDGKEYRKPKPRKKPEPKPVDEKPAEVDDAPKRKVQVQSAVRAITKSLGAPVRELVELTYDPRWPKAVLRLTRDDAMDIVYRATQLSLVAEAITSALGEDSPAEPPPAAEEITVEDPETTVLQQDSDAPKLTKEQVKSMMCERCSVILPSASTGGLCDDCDGVPESPVPTKDNAEPPAVVVHNETISKRSHERRRFGVRKVSA